MSKKSFSPDVKILALQYLEKGRYTQLEICKMFSVNRQTLQIWRALYKFGGIEALTRPKKNKVYSKELKQSAVEEYLAGKHSMFDILAKYGISSLSVFKKWLKIYTSHSELKDSG
ncbi:MAG: helix-turn-helix domain-containing protein, partial [Solibacillus sp.]